MKNPTIVGFFVYLCIMTFLMLCLINTFSRRFFQYHRGETEYVSFVGEVKQLFVCFLYSIPTVLIITLIINLIT